MKKILIFITIFTLTFFFTISEKSFAAKVNPTGLIDQYIKVNSVKKSNGTIKVNYTVLKKVQPGNNLTISSYWDVYKTKNNSKTASLKTKKGKYSVTLKPKNEVIGPQRVEIKSSLAAGQYVQVKRIKTFYKFPPKKTTSHTMTKKEAYATHIAIASGITTIKFVGKKSPYKVILNLATYGAGTAYTLKSLNIVSGYPSPAAGQYFRTTTSYSSKGPTIAMKIWTNKSSYEKGVKAIYSYSETYKWVKR